MNCSCIIVASCYFGLTIGVMAPNNTDNTDEIEATDKAQPTTGIIAGLVFPWARLEAELRWHRDTLHGYNPPDVPGEPGELSVANWHSSSDRKMVQALYNANASGNRLALQASVAVFDYAEGPFVG